MRLRLFDGLNDACQSCHRSHRTALSHAPTSRAPRIQDQSLGLSQRLSSEGMVPYSNDDPRRSASTGTGYSNGTAPELDAMQQLASDALE